ncbi:CBN-GBH-1 protein [Aphelenchoides avenae]|nr:CBN-GBH-1 protein [Aphelenchus avenae]
MAYASGHELPYHTDFPSLTHPPQLQLLHMIQRAETGGLSMFVDGFRIAEAIRKEHPKHFEALCSTDIEYIEEGFDVHDRDGREHKFDFDMAARHKVIRLDEDGRIEKIQFGNAMRSWFFDTGVTGVQAVYDALKCFTYYCYRPENQLVFRLENGDTVLWANTRVLHARTDYKCLPGKKRSVMGCYFSWDILKSRIRVIRDRLQLPENQQAV